MALLLFLAGGVGVPAASHAQSALSMDMVGAGTVQLESQGGNGPLTAACPVQAPLANPDNGEPLRVCSPRWAPVCTPAAGATSCTLTVRATARVPGPPEVTAEEQTGWLLRGWTAGPCAGSTSATCTFPIGTCTAGGGCSYTDAGLQVEFNDRRAPAARFVDTPPATSEAPDGLATFTFRSNEYAGQEVARFECRLDYGGWTRCAGPPETHEVRVADGTHVLQVRAVDPSGNVQSRNIPLHRWTQQTPPAPAFQSGPPDGAFVNDPSATFTFHAHPAATLECRLDGGEFAACSSPHTLEELSDGRHELAVRATRSDTDPDRSATATRSWFVDTVEPATVILSGPDDGAVTTTRSATFTFRSEPVGDDVRFQCALDFALPAPCDPSGTTYVDLSPGPHDFVVTAIDRAGNRESTGQLRSWLVVADEDADGFFEDDCDDRNAAVYPGAPDPSGDGVDQDCDGVDGFDMGGGFGTDDDFDGDPLPPVGGDCDDGNPVVSSMGAEVPENGVDDDCDGEDALKPAIGLRLKARWSVGRHGSRLLALRATGVPARTVLRLTCRPRCEVPVKHIQVRRARQQVDLLASLRGRPLLRAGAVLEVRATKSGRSPEGRTWRVRPGRPPLSEAFCEHARRRERGRC